MSFRIRGSDPIDDRKAAGGGIVSESRLADAVQGVTSVATEAVVEALNDVSARDAEDRLVGDHAEVVIKECHHDFCSQNEIIQQNIPANGIVKAIKQSKTLPQYVRC